MWLATYFGLVRFDGVKFTTFGAEIMPELVRSMIWELKTDRAGRLWLGTGKGGILTDENGVFHLINKSSGLPHQTVYAMCEDNAGVMWVSTGDGNISRIVNGGTVQVTGYLRDKPSNLAIQIVKDSQGELWFTQGSSYGRLVNGVATNVVNFRNGLVHLCASRKGGLWMTVNRQIRKINGPPDDPAAVTQPLPFGNYEIQKLCEDRSGHLWVGTRNLGLFELREGELRKVLPSKNRVLDIFEDSEGSLWVAMEGGGLSKIRPRVFRLLNSPSGLTSSKVLSVCADKSGAIWAAPQVGGLIRYPAYDNSPEMIGDTTNVALTTVLPDHDGGIWAGTVTRGLLHYDGNKVEHLLAQSPYLDRQMRVLCPDAPASFWIALFPSGLCQYGDGQIVPPSHYHDLGVSESAVWAITKEQNGAVWFGDINGSLQQLKNDRVRHYSEADGLPGTAIGALCVDTNGTLWVGTLGSGLGCLHDGKFKFASVAEGLHDNVISQIVEDDYGFLWLGSSRGIFRVRTQELAAFMAGRQNRIESIAYGKSDGMANVECSGGYQPSVWKTPAGQMCFATSKGVIYFDPASLPLNSRPPPLALDDIAVDGQPIAWTNVIRLNSNYKNIEFDYTAPSFIAPEKVYFRRQLVGFDANWVEDGTRRSATYPRLDPGQYKFQFTACNNDGVWNENPMTITVFVTPAWWQTVWFHVLMVLVFALLVAGLARYFSTLTMRRRLARLEQAHALEKERTRIARDIHDDVGARLTQMAYLSELASAEVPEGLTNSRERLNEIVRASRQTVHALDEIVWAVNPQKDSLAHLLEYISQYANSFFRSTEIRCRQDLPANVPEWALPSEFRHHLFLAAKEALNNIQKHSKCTEVWIRVTFHAPQLEIVIEDNGTGFSLKDAKPGRDGLQNMRARLTALGGTCQLSSDAASGTRLVMTVRLPELKTPLKS